MLTQALIADADAFGGRDRLGSGLVLKVLCRAVQAVNTANRPGGGRLKGFEVASRWRS
jgi:hypothetical protein